MTIDFENGEVWLIDKPYEWTSFDVIRKLKYALIRKTGNKKVKIGHAGTLDPLATGLLVVCVGKATKKIDSLQAGIKEYTGTFVLGATRPSYDLETEIDAEFPYNHIANDQINETVNSFIGEQEQTAPIFSAKIVEGRRMYVHAREGNEIVVKSHRITVYEFEITKIQLPEIEFRIVCSKGTYIRSIANDFGKKLNSGAYLSSLCRTKSGDFSLENAKQLNQLFADLTGEELQEKTASKRAFLHERKSNPE